MVPPDTNGDIGYDPATGEKYYMQWVNISLQIWDVTNPAAPVSLYGPVDGNTPFAGFGGPAMMVYFDLFAANPNVGGMLPSDLDGVPPPAGTPNFFAEWDDSSVLGDPQDTLRIWEFHVDWGTTANSTIGLNASYDANYEIPTSDVDPNMCDYSRNCIPQPGGTAVDAFSWMLMYRLQYRNFGTHQALVSNHTVDASGSDRVGVYWFELRNSGAGWVLYQDGVYAPGSEHR